MSVVTDLLPFFRDQWATRMTDSCVVKEETSFVLNQITGVKEPVYTTRYTGGCEVRPATAAEVQAGQQLNVVFDHVVFIPWDEIASAAGHLVDITSATDPKLTGKTFVVRGIPTDTLLTRRTLFCEDNQGG